ncbi:MAG: sugar phosphate nucleotidyltransferase [Candidatus Kryptoniota bacterium]
MRNGKLVILAGGISSRMKKSAAPGTIIDRALISDANEKAKSMIGVGKGHRPFLDYLLYNAREAGYRDVVIVISEKDESIREYYGSSDKSNNFYGLKISYSVQKIPAGREKPLGTADALHVALESMPEWKGERFTVCNSDNLYSQKALKLMLEHNYLNAMIDYDRNALEFDTGRIEKFAVTLKDEENFLLRIIEKPTGEEINQARTSDGTIGVSMNIFSLNRDMIYPFLESVPFHPVRDEKELPEAVNMMVAKYPKSLFCFPLSEHVPDLTAKEDIIPVQRYLENHFSGITF